MNKKFLDELLIHRFDAHDEVDDLGDIKYTVCIFTYMVTNYKTMSQRAEDPWGDPEVRQVVGRNADRTIAGKKKKDKRLKVTFYMPDRPNEHHEGPEDGVAQRYVNSLPRDTPSFPLTVKIVTAVDKGHCECCDYNSSDESESSVSHGEGLL